MADEQTYRDLRERPSIAHILTDHTDPPAHNHLKEDLSRFFIRPKISHFCLTLLLSHIDYTKNDAFRSLVDLLQEWNRSMKKKTDKPTQQAFMRCKFIFSNLMYSLTLDAVSRGQMVEQLAKWNHQQRTNKPDTSVFRKKRGGEEDWLVRETFRTNMAQQIDSYHRKVLGYSLEKDREMRPREKSEPNDIKKSDQKQKESSRKGIPSKKELMRYRDFKESIELQKKLKEYKMHRSHLSKQSLSSLTDSQQWTSATTTPNSPTDKSYSLTKQIAYRFSRIHLTDHPQTRSPAELSNIIGLSLIDLKDKISHKDQTFKPDQKNKKIDFSHGKSSEGKLKRVRRLEK